MARGTTLLKLLDGLRAETNVSLNPAHNIQAREIQVSRLQRVQEQLWDDFAWPHLRIRPEVTVQAGQRYVNLPPKLSIERLERIEVFRDGWWVPLHPQIEGAHYSVWNSDLGQQDWPIRAWQLSDSGHGDIEIWPIPNQAADSTTRDGYLRFIGIRNLNRLTDEADTADLDDRLLVLYAAAEMLQSAGDRAASLKLNQAQSRYLKLKGSLSKGTRFQMFGLGGREYDQRRFVPYYKPPIVL